MPSLRDIRRHVQSVHSINKVTKAMEVVALARNRRLTALSESSRGFAELSWRVLQHLAEAAGPELADLPVYRGRSAIGALGLVVFTSDRGMVGGYNHKVLTLVTNYLNQRHAQDDSLRIELITVGRIGRNHWASSTRPPYVHLHADLPLPSERQGIDAFTALARLVLDGFAQGNLDQIAVAYTQARSGALLQPAIRHLLPLAQADTAQGQALAATAKGRRRSGTPVTYLYEPEPEELLRTLLPRIIRFQLYEAYLQSRVAENTSRMFAMRSATQNGQELIDQLATTYNKARQQAITSELLDIIGGSVGQVTHD
jgi:F-type H+-transporting ATPase subunit gamma